MKNIFFHLLLFWFVQKCKAKLTVAHNNFMCNLYRELIRSGNHLIKILIIIIRRC